MDPSTNVVDLAALYVAACATRDELRGAPTLIAGVDRLEQSVLRPLAAALGDADAHDVPPPTEPAGLWDLARRATELRVAAGADAGAGAYAGAELLEATAALQDLACALDPPDARDGTADRLAELRHRMADLPPEIRIAHDGPYLVTNVEDLTDWLGCALTARPQMALCRCGQSERKPFCDGSHARVGFSGGKGPERVPDRRDTYDGVQVTVYDNRGICQHSGFCTDRLASVFHSSEEPFVTPSGGRMDEIIRAVRNCPSGALSFAIDDQEARDEVDRHATRGPAIEVSKDGPYRITGEIQLCDEQGGAIRRNEGSSREHYALCRCGASQNKPFCSGMHWYVDFHDPVPDGDRTPTMFEWCGGLPALTRMTHLFYEKYVPEEPLLSGLFARMSPDHPERVARWLAEVFGGPSHYSNEYGGYPRMISQHLGKGLTEDQRATWVSLLLAAARDAGLPNDPEFRSAFQSYIEWGSRLAVENSQAGAKPPANMPMPRWGWNTGAGPPGSRISALTPAAEDADTDVVLPGAEETVGFEQHVRPLFRDRDRRSMQFAFDLWSYDEVGTHADAILERVRAGTMPCDGAWPDEWVDVLSRWIASGKAP